MTAASRKRLLVIQPMVGIGDMVWHKPWLDAMLARYDVTLMAKPSAQAGAVMGEYPDLKMIPLYRSERGQKGRHDGFLGLFRMAAAIRATQAEEVWILHRSWRYGLAALIAGIPLRSGYGLGKQRYFLNGNQGLPKALKGAHPRDAVTHFCAEKGITPEDDHPQIKVSDDEVRAARSLFPDHRSSDHRPPDHCFLVICGVGAADVERQWNPKRFAGLIDRLSQTHPDVRVALCGSPAEKPIGEAVLAALSSGTTLPMMVFDQTVRQVIALHRCADLYIGNDTSLINIAAAVGTPAIRIFASSLPVLDSPLIETFYPDDPARMDIAGSIDDIDDQVVAERARAKLNAMKA